MISKEIEIIKEELKNILDLGNKFEQAMTSFDVKHINRNKEFVELTLQDKEIQILLEKFDELEQKLF